MIPILFQHDATTFDSFGMGALVDAIRCEVDEERNGVYEAAMQYPITGAHYAEIVNRSIILAKPNYTDDPQPFRIYKNSKPINGIVTFYARHLKYDLGGYVDAPFQAVGIQSALINMTSDAYCYPAGCPFELTSDISLTGTMNVKAPSSVHSLMGGVAGSLIDLYGGEWSYDRYTCRLNAHRGSDRGFTVRYAKNLTELTQDESVETLYTAVYPFYHNTSTDELVVLPEKVVTVFDTDEFTNVLTLNLTEKFENTPTVNALRQAAQAYIENNQLDVPKINITLDFVQEGFKERVDLCDTIHVYFDALGVSVSEKCIRTKWDVLAERYLQIEVGYARNSIAKTIAEVKESAQNAIEVVSRGVGSIAAAAASKVTGNLGGYVIMHDSDGDGHPDEILIMDTDDIETAVNVIRMNDGGIAFSNDGYDGEYHTAWNIDGEFVADFITAGTLKANMVKILGDTNFWWDAGNIVIQDPSNANHQIRIGKYDGTHYGIGFTTNGGSTWDSAMTFDGLNVSSIQQSINQLSNSVSTLSSDLNVEKGKISANTTAITNVNGRVDTANTNISAVAGNLLAEITRAQGQENAISSRITATDSKIATEVQKGLNGQGGYSSVYQTASQVQTTIANNAYTKNTTVTISSAGVDIATGGHFTVDATNLEIKTDGTLSAEKAYLSGSVYSNGNPVLTRGGDIVISTSQPASGKAGMVWIKPDPSSSVGSEYSFTIPSSWGSRLALYNNQRTGTLSGQGVSTSYTNCKYTIDVPIYIRAHSGTPAGGTLRCVVSDGSRSITFTASVSESATGTGNRVVTMTASSSTWIGGSNSLSFTLSCDQVSGYYVYNVLNSSDTASSIHLSCTASGSSSGWVPADVKVYV